MRKIRRDDEVIILSGRDRSKTGRVLSVLADGRALVGGINKVKRHVKPNPDLNRSGGIEESEAPINISNLALVDPDTKKAGRVKIISRPAGDNSAKMKKVRVFKASGKEVVSVALTPQTKASKKKTDTAPKKKS